MAGAIDASTDLNRHPSAKRTRRMARLLAQATVRVAGDNGTEIPGTNEDENKAGAAIAPGDNPMNGAREGRVVDNNAPVQGHVKEETS